MIEVPENKQFLRIKIIRKFKSNQWNQYPSRNQKNVINGRRPDTQTHTT